jgi:hypothetical protein
MGASCGKQSLEFLNDIASLNPNDKAQLFIFLNKYYDKYNSLSVAEQAKYDDLFKVSSLEFTNEGGRAKSNSII